MKKILLLGWLAAISGQSFAYEIIVQISGMENQKGQIISRLFTSDEQFPKAHDQEVKVAIKEDKTASVTFSNLDAGDYGIMVVHDEDGNDKLSTNFFGLPKEAVGASNNARPKFGPPKWKDIKIELGAEPIEIAITVAPIL